MRRIVTGGLVFLAILSSWTPASAEIMLDVYGGASFTQSRRMTVERLFAAEIATRKVSYDGNFVVGARGGVWFDYIGVGIDFSFFQVDGDLADSDVFSNSLFVMARAPLMQAEAGVSIDVVRIIQAMVLLFVAADAIVRYLFRLGGESGRHIDAVQTGWGGT